MTDALPVAEADEARRPGRPRSARADRAILDATTELYAERGFDGLTMEGVAARAGVSKATLYRRYPCKIDLVMAAVTELTDDQAPPLDTGSTRADLRGIVAGLVHLVTETVAGRILPMMVAETHRNPALADANHRFVSRRRAATAAAVRRGIGRGDVRADVDVDLVIDLIAAPIFYRHLMSGEPLDGPFVERLTDTVMQAVAP
jgi:AcrR family transcriptional regulator